MKLKKLLSCIAVLLFLCGCNIKSNESSSKQEEIFYTIYLDVSFYGSVVADDFNEKFLDTCAKGSVSSASGPIDFDKYNIDFDKLVAGEYVCIDTSTTNPYGGAIKTDLSWRNGFSFDGEILDMYVQKAEVVELTIKNVNGKNILVDENNPNINYDLYFEFYTASVENGENFIRPIFHSLLGGKDYTLIEDLKEGTKVFGTFTKSNLKENQCLLHALYSFDPYINSK